MEKYFSIYGKKTKKKRKANDVRSSSFTLSKGYVYTLEVFLAVSLVLVTLVFLYRTPPEKPQLEISIMKLQGMHALEYLDKKDDLREFIGTANESDIERRLNDTIVRRIDFEIDICTITCNETGVPRNKSVISVDYYIAGYRETINITKIKLWMWRK